MAENNIISAEIKSGEHAGKSASVEYDFGSNAQEMIDKFGDAVVFSNAKANMIITLQSGIRRCLARGEDPQAWADSWKPGMARARGKSRVEKAGQAIAEVTSEEELKAIQAQIKARLQQLRGVQAEAAA